MKIIKTPLDEETILKLRAGDFVNITGIVYVARDAAHKKFIELLKKGRGLPVDLHGQIIYYAGPTPAPPGAVIGSCGPTTSSRMDMYTVQLFEAGLKATIGKGTRCESVKNAIVKHKAIYFITYGGCGAYLSQYVKDCKVIAFPQLGPEAVYKISVENFPAIVGIDSSGRDIYSR